MGKPSSSLTPEATPLFNPSSQSRSFSSSAVKVSYRRRGLVCPVSSIGESVAGSFRHPGSRFSSDDFAFVLDDTLPSAASPSAIVSSPSAASGSIGCICRLWKAGRRYFLYRTDVPGRKSFSLSLGNLLCDKLLGRRFPRQDAQHPHSSKSPLIRGVNCIGKENQLAVDILAKEVLMALGSVHGESLDVRIAFVVGIIKNGSPYLYARPTFPVAGYPAS